MGSEITKWDGDGCIPNKNGMGMRPGGDRVGMGTDSEAEFHSKFQTVQIVHGDCRQN